MKNSVKRFTSTEIVTYRLSNSIKSVSFDTLEEAKKHVEKEMQLHPRSKKLNRKIVDTVEGKTHQFLFSEWSK